MTNPPDFNAILSRARAGERGAQYELATALVRAGRREDAEIWLQAAAAGGHPGALYTLANRKLFTIETTPDGVSALRAAAECGSPEARRLLAACTALGVDGAGDERAAIDDWIELARGGDPVALAALACALAIRDIDDAAIADIAAQSALEEPVGAAFVLARAAAGRPVVGDLAKIALALDQSAYPRAPQLRAATAAAAPAAAAPIDWRGISEKLTLKPAPVCAPERLSVSPDIVIYRNVVAPEICEYLIAHAASRLGPALVYDPTRTRMVRDVLRTSSTASLSIADQDLALIVLNRLLALAAGAPEENGEFLSVMRYAPGQEYKPHFDCIPPGPDFDRSGQRSKTALLFLNDDFEGGRTRFASGDLEIRAGRGDILVFSNVTSDGAPDRASRHAGMPVLSGEKWIASKWFRTRKFLY